MSVNVTTWQEFLTAASGNDKTIEINLPENAVWDLAEIEPEGHSGQIYLCGKINGNGTQIKNLVLQNGLTQYQATIYLAGTMTDLHFLNCHFVAYDAFVALEDKNTIMQLCTISAVVSGGTSRIFGGNGGTVYRCALNLEFATGHTLNIASNNYNIDYLNAKIASSAASTVRLTNYGSWNTRSYIKNSYVILDVPNVSTLTGDNTEWNVIRCSGSSVTSLSSFTATNFSLGVAADFPNVSTVPSGIKLISEPQLRDAAYLQSIGFPIGV